jgi:peptide deformylase
MAILPIYLFGSSVLRKKAKPVDQLTNALIKLVYDMTETMHQAHGIGLAANQVGELRQVIVVDMTAVEESEREEDDHKESETEVKQRKTLVLINPEILSSGGAFTMEEGCLSIPEVRAEVTRPESIRLKFKDMNFNEVELETGGLLARVIQHEVDHLKGVLFIDYLSRLKRASLKSALRAIEKGEVDASYPIVVGSEV